MNTRPLKASLLLLGLPALISSALAGSATFDFNTDPSGILSVFGNAVWRPTGGVGNTGYMSITDAANGRSGTIVFDDLDAGGIVNSFTFSCDLRTGGGTNDPADGYSVNFARESDPVIASGSGFPIAPEEGTGTGISVILDEYDNGGGDVIGVSVRVDGVQINQTSLPTKNGNAADTTSLQTGPASRPVDVNFNVADHTFVNLNVKLDPDGTLDVNYKGVPILSNFATTYFPSAGRLVFAGRTGDANSNHHVDNISITTTTATLPVISSATLTPLSFNAVVTDSAISIIDATKPVVVKINGNTVAASVSKTGSQTSLSFTGAPPNFFPSGVSPLVITATDTNNNPLTLNGNLVVAAYSTLNSAWAAAPGQVNTANQTFLARVHQIGFARDAVDSNILPYPERQIQNGYWDTATGAVAANLTQPAGQESIISGVLNWDEAAGTQGNFSGETLIPGIPGTTSSTDNIVGEIFTWLQLPAGVTRFGVNSDDGFTLSIGSSPLDVFRKSTAGVFSGGRGASDTLFDIAVPTAGLYPVRLLWWEGGGGANLEFFTVKPDNTKVLINDTIDVDSIKAFHEGVPAKPSIHAIAPFPSAKSINKHPLLIELVDGVASVNDASIAITIDGSPITPTVTNSGLSTNINYLPPSGKWPAGTHTVSLTYLDSAATSRTETWNFSVDGNNYVWKGNATTVPNILDPSNWVGDVPTNDGTNINLGFGDTLGFATGSFYIPDDSGRQINVANGARIFIENGGGNKTIDARVNMEGTGTDTNGAFYISGGDWGKPQNLFLTNDAKATATGQRFRIDGAANRLDLNGKTLTIRGNNEFNLVNTNAYNTSGVIDTSILTGFEGQTRLDPNITVKTGPNVLVTSWDGRSARREAKFELGSNSIIETRLRDQDLTYTNEIKVATGNLAILKPTIQNNGAEAGNGVDMRLNIMGKLTGGGTFRAEGDGTLVLSGSNDNTGGTNLAMAGTGKVVAAGNNSLGTAPVTVTNPSSVQLTNAGGLEYRDANAANAAISGSSTVINPVLSGLHSYQAYGNTRWAYTGKIRNPQGTNVLYSFAEQYDDQAYLVIDGDTANPVLNNTQWENVSTGQVSLSPGEHDIMVTVFDGGGGAGPNTGNGGAFPDWNTNKAIAYSTNFALGGATTNAVDYNKLGDGWEVYQGEDRSYANGFILNADLTLSTELMNGYDATVSGPITGTVGNLTIVGETPLSGTASDQLILSGTSTYTGTTTLTAARVLVTGNNTAATGNVSVTPGSVLGGTGTIGGATTVQGSLSPGVVGIGTLNVANSVVWEGGGDAWKYQVGAGNTSDLVNITGDFVKVGSSTHTFDFQNTGGTGTYKLVQWTGTTAFTAANFSATGLYAGNTGTFQIIGKALFLNLTGPAPGSTGYTSWAATAFPVGTPAGDRDPSDDPDGDGLTNLMEYALNTTPGVANAGPVPEIVTVGPSKFLQVRWTRPNDRTDITTIGQVSTNLT
ncbi:MAG: hypothetical protein JWL81_2643, partial [Verrucomicrobiales bacterium]|nr:hypothetical protein [Verrucomicrobiales bacterium]